MRRGKRIAAALLCCLLLCQAVPMAALASGETPYQTYNKDKWGNNVASPNNYLPTRSVTGAQLGCGDFSGGADLFYSEHFHEVYVADAGNRRLVVLSERMELLRVIDGLTTPEGEEYTFGSPRGVFVKDDGVIYVADAGNKQVIRCSREGELLSILPTPESPLLPDNFNYQPTKVVVDGKDRVYILSTGIYQGLIYLDTDGSFIKFFGPNNVEMTFQRQMMKIWKTFLTDDAAATMQAFNPIEYSNIFLAGDGYIYATAAGSENGSHLVTKLNPLGIDCLPYTIKAELLFSDVTVDDNGTMTCLDTNLGLLWQIDMNGNSMGVFGGLGDQVGLFRKPVSLIEVGQNLYVLDADKNSITEFTLTEFGGRVSTALGLYNQGLYLECIEPWKEVVRQDANLLLAYVGLGKAYYQLKDYETAMYYFKLANDRSGYSQAYREASLNRMRASFGWYALGAVLIAAAVVTLGTLKKRGTLKRWRECLGKSGRRRGSGEET